MYTSVALIGYDAHEVSQRTEDCLGTAGRHLARGTFNHCPTSTPSSTIAASHHPLSLSPRSPSLTLVKPKKGQIIVEELVIVPVTLSVNKRGFIIR